MARLAGFQRAHPEIEQAVSSSYDLDSNRRGAADVGIRYGAKHAGGSLFEDAMVMYEAAAAGQGVALTLKTLFEGYAAQRQPIKPFSLEVWDSAYCIVLSPEAMQKPALNTFTNWLQREASA